MKIAQNQSDIEKTFNEENNKSGRKDRAKKSYGNQYVTAEEPLSKKQKKTNTSKK